MPREGEKNLYGPVWQVPMVISPSMPSGSFLLGGFQQSTVLFSRETLNVQVAFQNEEDFIRNRVCPRGELRSGLAVPVRAGILKGSFVGGAPSALRLRNGKRKKARSLLVMRALAVSIRQT